MNVLYLKDGTTAVINPVDANPETAEVELQALICDHMGNDVASAYQGIMDGYRERYLEALDMKQDGIDVIEGYLDSFRNIIESLNEAINQVETSKRLDKKKLIYVLKQARFIADECL